MDTIMLWLEILLPILSIAIPVFATIYTVNSRIKNENRENHRPYLLLQRIDSLEKLDIYSYYFTLIGRNYGDIQNLVDLEKSENLDNDIFISLILDNVGYGVATNIKFYNLLSKEPLHGNQANSIDRNQKLFTTLDMAAGSTKNIQARIITTILEQDGIEREDHNRILCVYQDLNGNCYDFIISINIKPSGHYDFFAYQPSSRSYERWMKENKKQYKAILKKYSRL